VRTELEDLKAATEADWEQAKSDWEKISEQMEQALEEASDR
jgi:hypothetical protein